MASNDLFLRSDAQKSEVSPSNNLRLRSDAQKAPAPGVSIAAMAPSSFIAGTIARALLVIGAVLYSA